MSTKPTAQVTTSRKAHEFRLIAEKVAQATGNTFVFKDGSNPNITIVTNGDFIPQDDHRVIIDGNSYGQVSQTLINCNNTIQQHPPGEQRDLLKKLVRDVSELISRSPKEDRAEFEGNLELLVKAVTAKKPNRKWYMVSSEGLLEASKWVKDFSSNIAATIGQLGTSLWSDFILPKVGTDP